MVAKRYPGLSTGLYRNLKRKKENCEQEQAADDESDIEEEFGKWQGGRLVQINEN